MSVTAQGWRCLQDALLNPSRHVNMDPDPLPQSIDLLDDRPMYSVLRVVLASTNFRYMIANCISNLSLDRHSDLRIGFMQGYSTYASQFIRSFEAVDYRLDPFTQKRLSLAPQCGPLETVTFCLQHKDCYTSVDEMLNAALHNEFYRDKVTHLLLGYLDPDHIKEQAVFAAFGNSVSGSALLGLLYSRWSSVIFPRLHHVVVVAFCQQTPDTDVGKMRVFQYHGGDPDSSCWLS